jgi:hypothetical protein
LASEVVITGVVHSVDPQAEKMNFLPAERGEGKWSEVFLTKPSRSQQAYWYADRRNISFEPQKTDQP